MAVQRSDSMNEVSQSDRIVRVIFEHAARISRVQDLLGLMRLNADFARDLIGADRCSLWLVDEKAGELWTMVAHGLDPIRIPLGSGLVGACVHNNEVVLLNDLSADPRFLRRVDTKSGYQTQQILCVPLRAEQRVIGALQLLNKPDGFTEADASLVGLVGNFAASAIESESLRREAAAAEVLRRELDLARDVQARLMPQETPAARGIECTGFCRPARMVGGDYYDLVDLEDGRFAFTLGDVSGKGIPAAVMMASIQTLLRSLLRSERRSLADAVSELNRTLYDSSTADRYSTLFCGVLNHERTQLTYVNAGHVQPMLLRKDGTFSLLPGGNLPVGILPVVEYEQSTVEVESGDLLVVVSDGIVEARNPEGDFWDELLVQQMVQTYGDRPVADLPAAMCAGVDSFSAGSEQYDDMTVVAVRVL